MGSSAPSPPNPNTAAIAGATADIGNFPFETFINSLSQTGGKANIGGTNYDFTGLGNAQQSNTLSDQSAQALLDIQNNYGSQYVQQRLADLQQSDPTGYAARQQLFNSILADSQQNPDRPLATDLQNQVTQTLQGAGQLDSQGLQQVQQGVRAGQVSNGIYLGNGPASQESSAVVNASDAQQQAQQQEGINYLQSGVSPQDVDYRRIQQSLSNLGAFTNNQTPEAEFGQLSAAGNGAAPFSTPNYSNPASINPSDANTGQSFANAQYGLNSGYAATQGNPFLTGLTTGINTLGTAAKLGANPFATNGGNITNGSPNDFSAWNQTPLSDFGSGAGGMSSVEGAAPPIDAGAVFA